MNFEQSLFGHSASTSNRQNSCAATGFLHNEYMHFEEYPFNEQSVNSPIITFPDSPLNPNNDHENCDNDHDVVIEEDQLNTRPALQEQYEYNYQYEQLRRRQNYQREELRKRRELDLQNLRDHQREQFKKKCELIEQNLRDYQREQLRKKRELNDQKQRDYQREQLRNTRELEKQKQRDYQRGQLRKEFQLPEENRRDYEREQLRIRRTPSQRNYAQEPFRRREQIDQQREVYPRSHKFTNYHTNYNGNHANRWIKSSQHNNDNSNACSSRKTRAGRNLTYRNEKYGNSMKNQSTEIGFISTEKKNQSMGTKDSSIHLHLHLNN